MPTTSVRRPISRLTRSSGFVERSLDQCSAREAVEGEQVLLGVGEQLGDLRRGRLELLDHRASRARAPGSWPSALKTSRSAAETSARWRWAAVLVHVADEVHRAALPRAAEHPGDRVLEALVRVGHAQPDAVEAAARAASAGTRARTPRTRSRRRRGRSPRAGRSRARRRRSPAPSGRRAPRSRTFSCLASSHRYG